MTSTVLTHRLKKARTDGGTIIYIPSFSESTYFVESTQKWDNYRTGSDNPFWRLQVARFISAATHANGYRRDVRSTPSQEIEYFIRKSDGARVREKWTSQTINVPEHQYFSGETPSEVSADNQAKSKLISRLRAEQTAFQGGVFLGELAESVRMLRSPVKSLRRSINVHINAYKNRRLRNGSLKARKRANRRILQDTWLEYSFGWLPLIADINEIVNLRYSSAHSGQSTAKAIGKDEISYSGGLLVGSANTPPYHTYEVRVKKEVSVRYLAGLRAVSNPGFSQFFGIAPKDFLPTAWEVMPWSFLIDYFSNLGKIVNAASYSRSNVSWAVRTVRYKVSSRIIPKDLQLDEVGPTSSFKWVAGIALPATGSSEAISFIRAPYDGTFIPSLEFRVPGVGSKQWLNIAALVKAGRRLEPFF